MADYDSDPKPVARKQLGVFTLIAGLITLCVSGYVLSDGADWWPDLDWRWPLAGGAVLIGILLLTTSLTPNRNRDR